MRGGEQAGPLVPAFRVASDGSGARRMARTTGAAQEPNFGSPSACEQLRKRAPRFVEPYDGKQREDDEEQRVGGEIVVRDGGRPLDAVVQIQQRRGEEWHEQ